ncbi:50S ribosomal protein L1 [Candidatus Daviesbacteria bacterium]|nr:50S ribosomal protein L1 [Candidatus Daviesbacteria bacterium]
MGKTKTIVIDDSLPQKEVKKTESKKPEQKPGEDLIAKINAELGVEEQTPQKKEVKQTTEQEKEEKPETKKKAKSKVPISKKVRSKKYQEATAEIDKTKFYPVGQAIELVKKSSYTKFSATMEAHINTDKTGIRGLVSLPFTAGKKLRILAFGKDADQSGADTAGTDGVIEEINKGKVDFDIIVTTPEWMPKLAKVARILGPRGLMPNPKNGTITSPSADGLKKAVASFQAGKTEYKTENKAAVLHLSVGKVDQASEEIAANIKTLVQTVGKTRVKKLTLSPTMGAGVKLDLTSV